MKLPLAPTHLVGLALFSAIPCVSAQNSSLPLAKSTTCDATCQQIVQLGAAFERDSHAHTPLDDFYSIPASFNRYMAPGTLLRVEAHTDLVNYTVPGGLTMSRIMYTSQSLNGTIVPASAYILWPYASFEYKQSDKPKGKFPLVAWAHGTSGVFSNCAPSNYRSLQYHFMVPYTVALEGFAVVATDYAGLGVTTQPNGEGSHLWGAAPAAANDIAYSIVAARKAFPAYLAADGPFVAMGHSQGGAAAWAFAERQAKAPQSGYRGTISISPPNRILDILIGSLANIASLPVGQPLPSWAYVALSIQPKIVAAVTTVFPSYNYSGFSPEAYDRWNNVLKPLQACLPTENLALNASSVLAKPGWTNDSTVVEWAKLIATGGKKIKGPLLTIVGEYDALPVPVLEQDVAATCKVNKDQDLEMVTYGGSEHFPVIQTSRMKWMAWIKEKISAVNVDGQCDGICGKKSMVEAFNSNYTVHTIPPNWLVQWVPSPKEAWKYSL